MEIITKKMPALCNRRQAFWEGNVNVQPICCLFNISFNPRAFNGTIFSI